MDLEETKVCKIILLGDDIMLEDMIHVCFPLHDEKGTYSKFLGVALCSLFENTQSKVTVHLIHDESVSDKNKGKIVELVDQYKQNIIFHKISSEDVYQMLHRDSMEFVRRFSIGTLFRLKMFDILSTQVERVISLDDDMIINLDIRDLWEYPLNDAAVAACTDNGIAEIDEMNVYKAGLVARDNYFNAGVLVLDLKKIRNKYHVFTSGLAILQSHPEYSFLEQDAFNYLFKNDVTYLPRQYNTFTRINRSMKNQERQCIFHFAGEHIRLSGHYIADRLYLYFLLKTPWRLEVYDYWAKREKEFTKIMQYCLYRETGIKRMLERSRSDDQKIFWGIKGKVHNTVMGHFILAESDSYVDNNREVWGCEWHGNKVISPEQLSNLKQPFYIIVTTLRYVEVKEQLENMGYKENEDFFDGTLLLDSNFSIEDMYV